ncbi:5057_t:CDS:2, partial [Paraglomus brasilianum]
MRGLLQSILLSLILTASLVNAQLQTGDVSLASQTSWYVCSPDPTNIVSYSITTYSQTVTSTPNFGTTKSGFSSPDVPPCTLSFVSVVVDPTNFARIFNLQTFYAWDSQSCITTCVNTCIKTGPIPSLQTVAWCLVVSNPNNAIVNLKISYGFGSASTNTGAPTTNGTVANPTITSTNGAVASPTDTNGSGALTTTIAFPSGVEKNGWN